MGKKKRERERHRENSGPCTKCLIGTASARLDQCLDAYEELRPSLQHFAGIEAYIRLREGRHWLTELGGAAHDQNLQHTCTGPAIQDAGATTSGV